MSFPEDHELTAYAEGQELSVPGGDFVDRPEGPWSDGVAGPPTGPEGFASDKVVADRLPDQQRPDFTVPDRVSEEELVAYGLDTKELATAAAQLGLQDFDATSGRALYQLFSRLGGTENSLPDDEIDQGGRLAELTRSDEHPVEHRVPGEAPAAEPSPAAGHSEEPISHAEGDQADFAAPADAPEVRQDETVGSGLQVRPSNSIEEAKQSRARAGITSSDLEQEVRAPGIRSANLLATEAGTRPSGRLGSSNVTSETQRLRATAMLHSLGRTAGFDPTQIDQASRRQRLPPDTPIFVGEVIQEGRRYGDIQPAQYLDPQSVKHALFTGASQSGKSHFGKKYTGELLRRGETVMVITPAKGYEWVSVGSTAGLPVRLLDGTEDRAPFALPALQPPVAGVPYQGHLDEFASLIASVGAKGEEGGTLLETDVLRGARQLYYEHGWDVSTGRPLPGRTSPPTVPTNKELLDIVVSTALNEYDVNKRGIAAYEGKRIGRFVSGAINAVLGRQGHPLDLEAELLTEGLSVIDTGEFSKNDSDIAMVMGMLLVGIRQVHNLWDAARTVRDTAEGKAVLSEPIRRTIIIEEAHRVANMDYIRDMVSTMLAEILASGTRIVIIEQNISLLPDAWLANITTQAHFNQPHGKNQVVITDQLPYPEEGIEDAKRSLAGLRLGQAHLYSPAAELSQPVPIKTPFDPNDHEGLNVEIIQPARLTTRTPACGVLCVREACSDRTIKTAQSVAEALTPMMASGRAWITDALWRVLTQEPVGAVPETFQEEYSRWVTGEGAQQAECSVGEIVDHIMLRHKRGIVLADMPFDQLTTDLAVLVRGMLDGQIAPGTVTDASFVPDYFKNLMEKERVRPFEGDVRGTSLHDNDPAPPLVYSDLEGVRDVVVEVDSHGRTITRPVTVAERLLDLDNAPSSMASASNREAATSLLTGDDKTHQVSRDLAMLNPSGGLDERFKTLETITGSRPAIPSSPNWTRIMASWPARFVEPYATTVPVQTQAARGAKV